MPSYVPRRACLSTAFASPMHVGQRDEPELERVSYYDSGQAALFSGAVYPSYLWRSCNVSVQIQKASE